MKATTTGPTTVSQRIVILDALRGFALLGIVLANFPEFSLWTFLSPQEQAAMPSHSVDTILRWLHYIFVDGKFYTIFSLLFGIGFSIIIDHAARRGANGLKIFYRRMTILLLLGAAHMFFLWSGDILMLYAAMGLILPIFRRCSGRKLLLWAAFFLLLPIFIDAWRMLSGLNPANYLYNAWWTTASHYGIRADNFAVWLCNAESYGDVHAFLMQGAVERMWEFVAGSRYFKVLGLFLVGYSLGRSGFFFHLSDHRKALRQVAVVSLSVGFPMSIIYAWSSMTGEPSGPVVHSVLYALSAYPMAAGYVSLLCLLSINRPSFRLFTILAAPGRMALSCYIGQTLAGMFIFYGIGLALGATMSLWMTELLAFFVFIIETILCRLWLRWFRFGPLEWLWRMLTYGKRLPLLLRDE